MTRQISLPLATTIKAALAAVLGVTALAQLLTGTWFCTQQLDLGMGSRRAQWGIGLMLGSLAVEVSCLAVWRLVTLGRRPRPRVGAMRRLVGLVVVAAAFACGVAVWLVVVLCTWPGPDTAFVVLFTGAAAIAAGVALSSVAQGRALTFAADLSATAWRLQAELDQVI